MVEKIVNAVADMFLNSMQKTFLEFATLILGWVNTALNSFWNDGVITGLFEVSKNVGRAIFVLAFIVMLLDIVEDHAANKPVYASTVIGNIFKALFFIEFAPVLGQYSLLVGERLMSVINLSESLSVLNLSERMTATGLIGAIQWIIMLVALIYFFIATLKRYSVMLIQILQCTLYIPPILRGDTTAMGGWLRQTVAISLTYFFQYLLFYLGLYFYLRSNLLPSMALWLGMKEVPKILEKYGLSMGTGGNIGSSIAGLAQTGLMLAR